MPAVALEMPEKPNTPATRETTKKERQLQHVASLQGGQKQERRNSRNDPGFASMVARNRRRRVGIPDKYLADSTPAVAEPSDPGDMHCITRHTATAGKCWPSWPAQDEPGCCFAVLRSCHRCWKADAARAGAAGRRGPRQIAAGGVADVSGDAGLGAAPRRRDRPGHAIAARQRGRPGARGRGGRSERVALAIDADAFDGSTRSLALVGLAPHGACERPLRWAEATAAIPVAELDILANAVRYCIQHQAGGRLSPGCRREPACNREGLFHGQNCAPAPRRRSGNGGAELRRPGCRCRSEYSQDPVLDRRRSRHCAVHPWVYGLPCR